MTTVNIPTIDIHQCIKYVSGDNCVSISTLLRGVQVSSAWVNNLAPLHTSETPPPPNLHESNYLVGRLGGVVVSAVATGSTGRFFNPGLGDGFLRVIKIGSTSCCGWWIKLEVSCRKILRHVKDPLKYLRYWQAKQKILTLSPFLLLAPKCLCW
jgi:hypothetical protein